MDPNAPDQEFEESIRQMLPTLPPPIRSYLTSGKYSDIARELMTRYRLHVDQGGVLERELMLLIMGLDSPQEFLTQLEQEGRIPDDIARSIAADVNHKVFIPMRDEMRHQDVLPQPPPIQRAPQARQVPSEPSILLPPRPGEMPPRPPMPAAPMPPSAAQTSPVLQQAPDWRMPPLPQASAAAPLPPRTVLPHATAVAPQATRLYAPAPAPERGAPPPNLPTYTPPPIEEPARALPPQPAKVFNPLPSLAKPQPLSSVGTQPPHTRYPADPYREPTE